MATKIKTWQILNDKLQEISTKLSENGRKEKDDLEQWIKSMPDLLGEDIQIIGEQVQTSTGYIDLLAIDKSGNLVIVELKRDRLSREALAQAIDYASDVSSWEIDKINEVCEKFSNNSLDELIAENFDDVNSDEMVFNITQRIILIGFSIDSALERMVEWLSESYDVSINAIVLNYIKTTSGDELLSKTSIIAEEIDRGKGNKRKYVFEKSDEKGNYEIDVLKTKVKAYFKRGLWTSERMRIIMLPYLLTKNVVRRDELRDEFARVGGELGGKDIKQAGLFLAGISTQLGKRENDFLRQIISYEYPTAPWEKDNFKIEPEYRELIEEILETTE